MFLVWPRPELSCVVTRNKTLSSYRNYMRKMNIQVLPLKVLVTRQVINKRMDYSNYLNGAAKEELDRLDKLAGDFRVGSSKLRIDESKGIQSDDWQDLKKKMPRGAVSYLESIEGKAEFSIVEQMKNGMRTWYIFDANGTEGDLMSEKGSWEERSHVMMGGSRILQRYLERIMEGGEFFFTA